MFKQKIPAFFGILLLFQSCRPVLLEEYQEGLGALAQLPFTQWTLGVILASSTGFFFITASFALLVYLLASTMYVFRKQGYETLYFSLCALFVSLLYLIPFLSQLTTSLSFRIFQMGMFIAMGGFYWMYRQWFYTTFPIQASPFLILFGRLVFGGAFLLLFFSPTVEEIDLERWVPSLLGTFVFLESLYGVIHNHWQKEEPDSLGSILSLLPFFLGALWIIRLSNWTTPLVFVSHLFYISPALLVIWQLLLTISAVQRQYSIKQREIANLERESKIKDIREEELRANIQTLVSWYREDLHTPRFSSEWARKTIHQGYAKIPRLSFPWRGSHYLESLDSGLPRLGVWVQGDSLLLAESGGKEAFFSLLATKVSFEEARHRRPSHIMMTLNKALSASSASPQSLLSGVYLHFLENQLLCATAGRTCVYVQKARGRIVSIQSDSRPVTYKRGLAAPPLPGETGKPFRIPFSRGDKVILTSLSMVEKRFQEENFYHRETLKNDLLGTVKDAHPDEIVNRVVRSYQRLQKGEGQEDFYVGVFQYDRP